MPVLYGGNIRIPLQDVSGETITFIFPGYDDERMQKGIQKLLDSRFTVTRRGVDKSSATKARCHFFDTLCCNVENLQYRGEGGEVRELDAQVPNWQGHIPPNVKVSVAMRFEEQETLSDTDREDL